LKNNKSWFGEGCWKLFDKRKEAKLQRLDYPSQINGDKLNNIRSEASRHYRNVKRKYHENKVIELATGSKKKILDTCREE
jgi:hypothetical protein